MHMAVPAPGPRWDMLVRIVSATAQGRRCLAQHEPALRALSEELHGFTAADLQRLCSQAAMVRRYLFVAPRCVRASVVPVLKTCSCFGFLFIDSSILLSQSASHIV